MDEQECPHCGSADYGKATDFIKVCLRCGYDTETGTSGVCPGGFHPKDGRGDICCDACWDRLPAKLLDVDGTPRAWRRRRSQIKRHSWVSLGEDRWWTHNNKTIRDWLAANQKDTP
jgi:hypothetical protein